VPEQPRVDLELEVEALTLVESIGEANDLSRQLHT
jgi:hypothetical protein